MSRLSILILLLGAFVFPLTTQGEELKIEREIILNLSPGENNPRNSEGDFVRLKDGRIMYVFSQYFGDSSSDDAHANLAVMYSSDEGKTWTKPEIMVHMKEGLNLMSVSLLRLRDERIAFMYLRKLTPYDCRPLICFSSDEGKTWTDPVCAIDEEEYFVVNNARLVELEDGTLIIPACLHKKLAKGRDYKGQVKCFISKDGGETWHSGKFAKKENKKLVFQEPGVVQLADGSLFMYIRTTSGTQFGCKSTDGGETWTKPKPTQFISPCSPMLIRPIPGTENFLAVWNCNPEIRNPLTLALLDEKLNILRQTTLDESEKEPERRFCYPAILALNEKEFLISYCAGEMEIYGLENTRIVKVKLK
ncbi:MAG: exo-alpha-sialidase [Thermoguttaceae bacterium]|nr:exo-alpha-sialidase [Thermoguttaceae bacterium]